MASLDKEVNGECMSVVWQERRIMTSGVEECMDDTRIQYIALKTEEVDV